MVAGVILAMVPEVIVVTMAGIIVATLVAGVVVVILEAGVIVAILVAWYYVDLSGRQSLGALLVGGALWPD
jgi:hypothetical protein